MNAYSSFALTHSSQICHYFNPSCLMLGTKQDFHGLISARLSIMQPLTHTHLPSAGWGGEWRKKKKENLCIELKTV